MTLIDERLARSDTIPELEDTLTELDTLAELETTSDASPPSDGRLAGRWVSVLAAAWVLIFTLGVALEPAPTDEEAFPLVGVALALALTVSWAVMVAGLVQRRRYGALASAGGAACLLALTLGCPLSGHHAALGSWWWFQVAGSLTLLGLSRAALVSSR